MYSILFFDLSWQKVQLESTHSPTQDRLQSASGRLSTLFRRVGDCLFLDLDFGLKMHINACLILQNFFTIVVAILFGWLPALWLNSE